MRTIVFEICIALAALAGFGIGYLLWDKTSSYYSADVAALGTGPENDLIRFGHALVVDTPRYIGRSAQNPAFAYGGNDLACQSCHLKAGLQPYAAPFVSTAKGAVNGSVTAARRTSTKTACSGSTTHGRGTSPFTGRSFCSLSLRYSSA